MVSPPSREGIPTTYTWRFENFYKSPLVKTTFILTGSAFALSRFSWAQGFFSKIPWKSTSALAGIVTLLVVKTEKGLSLFCSFIKVTRLNRLIFELFLTKNVVKSCFGSWEWCTEIEKGIYLSALPLDEMGFREWIRDNDIAVLSIVEDYEATTVTLGGRAIDFEGIDHKSIVSPDFLPLDQSELKNAAKWIYEKRTPSNGSLPKKVLIHCKSGVGRSSSALAAYYVLYQKLSAQQAREKIAEKRPFIYKEGSNHDEKVHQL